MGVVRCSSGGNSGSGYFSQCRRSSDLAIDHLAHELVHLAPFKDSRGRTESSLMTDLGAKLPVCLADRDMLASVLENLVRNGVEAMPDGGSVTVRTLRP